MHDGKRLPVTDFFIDGSEAQQFIFDKKRHNLRELNRFFLAIRKAGYMLVLYQRLTLVCDMTQHTRSVADERYRLAGVVERLDQRFRNRALRQVPHGAVAARVEDRVKIIRFHIRKAYG